MPCFREGVNQGVCDGKGFCVDVITNPCLDHGCDKKRCGQQCVLGDIAGICDSNGKCEFNINTVVIATHHILFKIVNFTNK